MGCKSQHVWYHFTKLSQKHTLIQYIPTTLTNSCIKAGQPIILHTEGTLFSQVDYNVIIIS